jgi:hypothetical protein
MTGIVQIVRIVLLNLVHGYQAIFGVEGLGQIDTDLIRARI